MSKEEIQKKIEDIERRKFENAMNDHWSADDFAFDRECSRQIRELKKQLEEEE